MKTLAFGSFFVLIMISSYLIYRESKLVDQLNSQENKHQVIVQEYKDIIEQQSIVIDEQEKKIYLQDEYIKSSDVYIKMLESYTNSIYRLVDVLSDNILNEKELDEPNIN